MVGIKEIAAELGLSRYTVSDVLNCGDKRYSEKTRKRIQEAAKRMGYRPNRVAQSLRSKKTQSIGILNFHSLHELSAMKLHKVLEEVGKTGFYPLVTNAQWHIDGCRESVGQMIESRVSGVLLVNPFLSSADFPELQRLLEAEIPVVSMGGDQLAGVPRYMSNKESGFNQMTRHLVEQGYKRILLMLQGRSTQEDTLANWHAESAIRGYQHCLNEHGLTEYEDIFLIKKHLLPIEVEYQHDPYVMGYWGMQQVLKREGKRPEAVICSNDSWAQGALRACCETGIRIPEDMPVCGFEDELSSRYGILPITTFRHPLNELVERSVKHLMELIESNQMGEDSLQTISGELIIRASSQAQLDQKSKPGALSLISS